MKGKKKYLLVVLLLLMFGCGSFVTYSIYRTSVSGNGSIGTAKWSVVVKDKSSATVNNLNFGVGDVTWTTNPGKNGKIAPGATGYIDYTIDATGSEVNVAYTATVTAPSGAPTGFTAAVSPSSDASGTIAYSTTSMTKTIRIAVTWTGGTDAQDIAAQDKSLTIPVTLTVNQAAA